MYAHREEFEFHAPARTVLEDLAEAPGPFGVPVFVLGEFLRVVTHPAILVPPSSRDVAIAALDAVAGHANARILHPGERFWSLLRSACLEARVSGNDVFDAQIVAVCQEHGVDTLVTEDRGFRRFPQLRTRPLAG